MAGANLTTQAADLAIQQLKNGQAYLKLAKKTCWFLRLLSQHTDSITDKGVYIDNCPRIAHTWV